MVLQNVVAVQQCGDVAAGLPEQCTDDDDSVLDISHILNEFKAMQLDMSGTCHFLESTSLC